MKKVLIVDDDTDLLIVLKSFLTRKGYQVKVTVSREEGWRYLMPFGPTWCYWTSMWVMQMAAKCKKIKAQAVYQHIPVILISANHDALQLYSEYGAAAGIHKPFNLSHLLNSLDTAV